MRVLMNSLRKSVLGYINTHSVKKKKVGETDRNSILELVLEILYSLSFLWIFTMYTSPLRMILLLEICWDLLYGMVSDPFFKMSGVCENV